VEGTALGHDTVVDLRGQVECQLYAAAPEAMEEVADDVELEESVHDDRQEDESGDGVAVVRHHRIGHFAKHLTSSSGSGLYHRARAAPVKAAERRRGQAAASGVVARR
jgi:hypothetical protein